MVYYQLSFSGTEGTVIDELRISLAGLPLAEALGKRAYANGH